MSCSSSQLRITKSLLSMKLTIFSSNKTIPLLIESTLITITSILAIRFLNQSQLSEVTWLAVPAIWIVAALIPTAITKRRFVNLLPTTEQFKHLLALLFWTCAITFSILFVGLWLLKTWGLALPLRPLPPQSHNWFSWLLYQFLYVAVAEEVFFRGYLQSNILSLIKKTRLKNRGLIAWTSIFLSAAAFAIAHVIVHGEIISAITFVPGLILGWLFIRTNSLLAPILFHGLANACYCAMAIWLT